MSILKTSTVQAGFGLLCVALLTCVSYYLVSFPFFAEMGMSPLILAIVLGMLVGNTWKHPASFTPGIQFAAKRLLRIAIILYGFRLTFQQIAYVGLEALIIDIIVVCSTLCIGYVIGRKVLKLDRELALLISAGSAICGAAAVLAVEEVLKSEPYKATVAIATVVLFGTLSMFLYPLLQQAGLFNFNYTDYGLFTGASIHEVAQAVAAGGNVSIEAAKIAVIVKMMRVLLLVPVLFLLAFFYKKQSTHVSRKKTSITIPWFAIGFVFVIAFHSLEWLPTAVVDNLVQLDILLLTMAMAAIGMETKYSKIKHMGMKPLYLAFLLFSWLITSVYVMVKLT
jgi:uncharacterized integral membrane protein (TIGR00698 family)